jgi:Cdc6-like AAA superfamily ATPase
MRKSDLDVLGFHEKLFLLGIAKTFKESQKALIHLTEAEQTYAVLCEEFDTSPNSHTQVWKYLRNFSALGIVKAEVAASGSRGRSTTISLPRIPAYELESELEASLKKQEE